MLPKVLQVLERRYVTVPRHGMCNCTRTCLLPACTNPVPTVLFPCRKRHPSKIQLEKHNWTSMRKNWGFPRFRFDHNISMDPKPTRYASQHDSFGTTCLAILLTLFCVLV